MSMEITKMGKAQCGRAKGSQHHLGDFLGYVA